MLRSLDGKAVLVTGASGGIGMAIARALHSRGASVALSGRREAELEALRAELGDRASVEVADLSSRDDLDALCARAGEWDVLVANAALPASGRLGSFSAEEIDRALDVNLRAPMQLARSFVPELVSRGAGHLVFISSMSGKVTTSGQSVYSATKFGLRGLGFSLHLELRGTGVGSTTVFPGFVSDAGLWADTGLKAPKVTGTSTPEQVADAVIEGILRDRAEVDVAPLFVRAGARLNGVAPGLVAAVSRRLGADDVADATASRQQHKR